MFSLFSMLFWYKFPGRRFLISIALVTGRFFVHAAGNPWSQLGFLYSSIRYVPDNRHLIQMQKLEKMGKIYCKS